MPRLHSFLAILAITLLVSGSLRAEVKKEAEMSSVLTPFEVMAEKVEFNKWTKVVGPNYILYTDAKAKEALELGKQFEMLHQASQVFLKRRMPKVGPLIVVLPTRHSDWKKIQSKGDVKWRVASTISGQVMPVVTVQYDWQQDGLASLWSMLGYRLTREMNLDGPLWFSRGLMKFFGTVNVKGSIMDIGKEGYAGAVIARLGFMPWQDFFTVNTRSPIYTSDSEAHDRYEAQCAAFAHFLLTHKDPIYTQRFFAWGAYVEAGNPITPEAFKEIFSIDWDEVEKQMLFMLKGGTYSSGSVNFPPAALQFPLATSTPGTAEMRELFVLAQVMNQRTPEADEMLKSIQSRGIKTDVFRPILGELCMGRGLPQEGITEVERVIASGTDNPGVFMALARPLFWGEARGISLNTRIVNNREKLQELCENALRLEPMQHEANVLLAWSYAFGETVDAEKIKVIAQICKKLDGHGATDEPVAALMVARWRSGQSKQALNLAQHLLKSAYAGEHAKDLARAIVKASEGNTAPQAPAAGA